MAKLSINDFINYYKVNNPKNEELFKLVKILITYTEFPNVINSYCTRYIPSYIHADMAGKDISNEINDVKYNLNECIRRSMIS